MIAKKMKPMVSIIYREPEILQLQILDNPVPNKNEFLIRIYGASIFFVTRMFPFDTIQNILEKIKILWEQRKLKSLIDKRYSFGHIPYPHGYIKTGHIKRNLVLALKFMNKITILV